MGLHVTPEQWAAAPSTPATLDEWRQRLGGGPGAFMAVQGAINRKRLQPAGGGRFTLTPDEEETRRALH